jgi:hypothetical protein
MAIAMATRAAITHGDWRSNCPFMSAGMLS